MLDDNGVKDGGEIVLPEEPPTLKQTTEEVPGVSEIETQPIETETAESKGASQRIRELNEAKKEAETRAEQAEEKAQSLAQRMAELTQPIGLPSQQTPNFPQYSEDQVVTPEQLQGDVTRTAQAIVDIQIKQNNAINRINNESEDVIRRNPELDPESPDFNKELSEAVTEAVENGVKANPYTASPKAIAEKMLKPYKGAVAKEVGQATENIAKQVTDAALRPTSVRQQEKPASEKSMAELEQELGIVIS